MQILCVLFCISSFFVFSNPVFASGKVVSYNLAWPGILPDSPFYKVKVFRNKILEKMIISPVKKVEFDLLMADKTILASKLLLDKGEVSLAKETVLKGENYYSQLVQDYNKTLLQGYQIPHDLDKKITLAAKKHQEVFKEMEDKVGHKDRETFQIVTKFSKINYEFIKGLRTPKKPHEK